MSEIHTFNYPTNCRRSDMDGLQVVTGEGLHKAYSHRSIDGLQTIYRPQPNFGFTGQSSIEDEKAASRRICGLRVTTFWLLCVIAILIVAGAVGGGIGGWVVNKESNKSSAMPANAAASTTSNPPSRTTTMITSIIATTTASVTAGNTASLTATSTSSSATATVTGQAFSEICPSLNNTIKTLSLGTVEYRVLCDSDWGGSGKQTLASVFMATFDDCIGICNTMNYFQDRTDVGATYNAEGTGTQTPGTCWCLGGSNKTVVSNPGNIVAAPL